MSSLAYGAQIRSQESICSPTRIELISPGGMDSCCTAGYVGAGTITQGLNRIENHDGIEQALRRNLPAAKKAMVPNVITFSGNSNGMSLEEGARNIIRGLNRVKKIVEDYGITLCMELLNSKVNHPDYMCDHTNWAVRVMEEVNSNNVKLLYDIYHMQIMEGDLISDNRRPSLDQPLPHWWRTRTSRTR